MLALFFGGSAAVGVNSLIKSPSKGDVVPVVVAAADIARGGTITGELLQTRDFPRELVSPGAITKMEDAIDRTVAIPLMRDDAILESKLAPKGAGRGMAALIPKGLRAFTITTTLASGVAGFILPGNRVDVLLTITEGMAGNLTGGGSTTTLLHGVEILAVDQRIDAPAENKVDVKDMRSVTLLVSPDEANVLELGQSTGNLHLALRNRDDRVAGKARPATMLDLQLRQERTWDQRAKDVMAALGEALARARPAAPASARREPPRKIRTLRGTNEGLVTVGPNDGS
jgi:pilus assembly protein CpaB